MQFKLSAHWPQALSQLAGVQLRPSYRPLPVRLLAGERHFRPVHALRDAALDTFYCLVEAGPFLITFFMIVIALWLSPTLVAFAVALFLSHNLAVSCLAGALILAVSVLCL
jgi:hypothetical protein